MRMLMLMMVTSGGGSETARAYLKHWNRAKLGSFYVHVYSEILEKAVMWKKTYEQCPLLGLFGGGTSGRVFRGVCEVILGVAD